MDLADYLDGGLARGGHRGGGGWHGGGGRRGGWGGGWYGGGPWYGGYADPILVEVPVAPREMQYVGIPANTTPMQCRAQIAQGLWRCGSTTYFDVSRYALRSSGLVALKGLGDLGEDPQAGPIAGLLFVGALALAGFMLTSNSGAGLGRLSTNREGLTFEEWRRAAAAPAKTPGIHAAWARGVDPAEWRAYAKTEQRAAR